MSKEAVIIQKGEVVDYEALTTLANGDVIPLPAGRVCIALDDAVAGEHISVAIKGACEFTAKTADTIAFGDLVYFDATEREITTTSTDNTLAGMAVSTKAGATAGKVRVDIG